MEEKKRITKNSIAIMEGVCLILLTLVALFSNDTPFAFLSKMVTYVLGFVGFWVLLPYIVILGFYLILRKRLVKFKVGISLWGFLILIISAILLLSQYATIGLEYNGITFDGYNRIDGVPAYLTFSNANSMFTSIIKKDPSIFNTQLGGGFLGFVFAGVINSAITPIGLNIVAWIMVALGLFLLFNTQIRAIYRKIKARIKNRIPRKERIQKKNIEAEEEITLSEEERVEEKKEPQQMYESFKVSKPIENDFELKKAHFDLNFEIVKEPEESEISKPISKPVFQPDLLRNEEQKVSIPFEIEEKKEEASILEEQIESTPIFQNPIFDKIEETSEIDEEIKLEKPNLFENKPVFIKNEEPTNEPNLGVDFMHRPQPKANLMQNYIYPTIDLLEFHENADDAKKNTESCNQNVEIINRALDSFQVGAHVVSYTVGPRVTRYDLQYETGVSGASINKYVGDISRYLSGASVRFEQIVEGKSTSGLEIPNKVSINVGLRESIEYINKENKDNLTIPFGKTISGDLITCGINKFPHLLVAGTTGSGKSIFVHSMIVTLLMRNKPEELKLLLVDPKKVEMTFYNKIPHLLRPVVTEPQQAYLALNKLADEMERRFNIFQESGVRDIYGFNKLASTKGLQPLPYIIVFVDEYADLKENCKDISDPITRIAAKSRAAGISMVIATQRPSVDVIDGVIKSNFSSRVALMTASSTDSQTILGEGGAEKLLGNGDMLVSSPNLSRSSKPRMQSAFVTEDEITHVCNYLREHYQPQFDPEFLNLEQSQPQKNDVSQTSPADRKELKNESDEALYNIIKEELNDRPYCSLSFLTRKYGIGFTRAGKMFQRLIQEGLVEATPDNPSRGNKVIGYVPGQSSQNGSIEQSTFEPDQKYY